MQALDLRKHHKSLVSASLQKGPHNMLSVWECFTSFIKYNSTTLEVLSSIIMAATTVAIACLTRSTVIENKLLRKMGDSPSITIYATPNKRYISAIDLVIANVGTGPAFDVTVEFLAEFREFDLRNLKSIPRGKVGLLKALPQGEKINTFFGTHYEVNEKHGKLDDFSIKTTYKNSKNEQFEKTIIISTNDFFWISELGEDPLSIIAKSLTSIEKKLK